MPLYHLATYADCCEQWAIRAESPEHAKSLIGNDPNGEWTSHATRLDAEPVDGTDAFVLEADDNPAIEEITPDHWAYRAAHRDQIAHSLRQNIAAISGDFHTHHLYGPFYDRFGRHIDGFVGQYDLCIAMAEALTDWEVANGLGGAYETAGVPWIEVIEDFVETVLAEALNRDVIPDPAAILPAIDVLNGRDS